MKKEPTSKRMASALIVTAFLAALFLLIAAYGPGSTTSSASASNITGMVAPHDGTVEATETHHPEATETHQPEATETHHPESTETNRPEATETRHPEATETHQVEGTETRHPEATETQRPEGTETEHPEATETNHPEGTETQHPEATGTEHPQGTETQHPEATGTQHPEATETQRPEATGTSEPPVPGTGSRTYPETGKSVGGIFLQYWDQHGGLQQQGYPISAVMQERSPVDGKTYTVQYFERAVFEHHPEISGNSILLSLLGSFRFNSNYPNGMPSQSINQTNAAYFTQTGHYVGGSFLKYWQEHGGVAQQGYPISDEFSEVSPLDGKTYTVQYFERAVFELHPENTAPYDVLLSHLGTFRYESQYKGK
jgi:hypothetical protein